MSCGRRLIHAAHRNPTVPENYTSDMAIITTAVHDIDITRWLLGEEIVATRISYGHDIRGEVVGERERPN